MIAVGLMAGTSLDGIDAALVELTPVGEHYTHKLHRFATVAYEPKLRERLLRALPPNVPDVREMLALDAQIGDAFGAAAVLVAEGSALDFIASHGQTLYHDGPHAQTLQIGNAFAIRDRTGVSVVYDFRSADCAAGGQGAPLVPYVDALLFADAREDRVVLNLGGIANVTIVPHGARVCDVVAFDTGPGNMLIDALVAQRTAGTRTFDRDGRYALAGHVDKALLSAMLTHPYFAQPPPKSTGREAFGAVFLAAHEAALAKLSLEDACATLCVLTAGSIADAIARVAPPRGRLIVSGGGLKNTALMRRLIERVPGYAVEPSDAMVPADAKEAVAFAILGYETLRGRPAGLPRVTGARHAALLGAIAPCALDALLAKIRAELARSEPA